MDWQEREPYAYWKGNLEVAETRKGLFKCNVSEEQGWNAHVYSQVNFNVRVFFFIFYNNDPIGDGPPH